MYKATHKTVPKNKDEDCKEHKYSEEHHETKKHEKSKDTDTYAETLQEQRAEAHRKHFALNPYSYSLQTWMRFDPNLLVIKQTPHTLH